MKYELTQEQYVSFLNQLPRPAQYERTIGGYLDKLSEGDYVSVPTAAVLPTVTESFFTSVISIMVYRMYLLAI